MTSSKVRVVAVDRRRLLCVPGNLSETLDFAVDHWLSSAELAIRERGRFVVALSGGSTPQALYQAIIANSRAHELDWSNVHLFWSDERIVPHTDPESNYLMAMQAGFGSLPIPSSQIHPMPTEGNLQEGAKSYEAELRELCGETPIDLIMLGLGEDGHTASLFPETPALQEETAWVVAQNVPKVGGWRMTFTYPLLHHAAQRVFYVWGSSKKGILTKVMTEKLPSLLPAVNVGTRTHPALWIADDDAANEYLAQKAASSSGGIFSSMKPTR